MGASFNKLTTELKNLEIDTLDGAGILLKGFQILVAHAKSPWAEMIKGICPPAGIALELLKAFKIKKKELDLDSCAALAIQQSYLEVFKSNLQHEKISLETRFELDEPEIDNKAFEQLSKTVEELYDYEFDASQIIYSNLHNEPIVSEYLEKIAAKWLIARFYRNEKYSSEAWNFARKISYQLYPQIIRIVAENPDLYSKLAEYLKVVDNRELRTFRDIEKYRSYLIELPLKSIFNETFALRDLYVELDCIDITESSKIKSIEHEHKKSNHTFEETTTFQLMQTVMDQLDDREHVIFIQAGPGKGKSVFCQMLAWRIAVEKHDWIPILVRLRDDMFVVDEVFEKSIHNYIRPHFDLTDELLRDRNFLFILDGFDELWLSTDSSHALKFFFERLSSFQRACAENNRWHHKIVITGRPMRIQDIEAELPPNFIRLKIANMANEQFENWLNNWSSLFGKFKALQFKEFLEKEGVFGVDTNEKKDNLRSLASEPLLLYMLGAMHRDGSLSWSELGTSKRIKIYDQAVSWVCGDTRKYKMVHSYNRVLEKSGIRPYELRQLLQETALCVWHGGREFAPISRIQTRLNDYAPEHVKKLFTSGFQGIHNLLASFYFQRHGNDNSNSGNVEFSHKSFGEYLAAERMAESLSEIGQKMENRYGQEEFRIADIKEVANRFYSVFGAAQLSPEVRDYVVNILTEEHDRGELLEIRERLFRFYIDYTNGRWMDEGIAKTQWDELKRYEVGVGLLAFEALVGINVFSLLCLLYKQTDESFEISGRESDNTFDENRFKRLSGFSEIVRPYGLLTSFVFRMLENVSLIKSNLVGLGLWGTNLKNANIESADLWSTDLRGANLEGANLRKSDLRGADLREANLRNADLTDANFPGRSTGYPALPPQTRT
jgi:hypothetical protein